MATSAYNTGEHVPFGTSELTPVLGGLAADLSDYPFPLALTELYFNKKSGTLHIRRGMQETSILVKAGAPVMLESSNPEDSLEHFLVQRKKLDMVDAYTAKSKAVETRRPVGEVLVEQGLLEPNELYKLIKLNMGQNILGIFRWTSGKVTFAEHEVRDEGRILLEISPEPLILRGVFAHSPFDIINKAFLSLEQDSFVLEEDPDKVVARLKLSGGQAKVVRALQEPKNTAALAAEVEGDMEALLRLLYAMALLKIALPAEISSDKVPAVTPPAETGAAPTKPTQDATTTRVPARDDGPPVDMESIRKAFAMAKEGTHYELLGVKQNAGFDKLKRAFLERCYELSPMTLGDKVRGVRKSQLEDLFLHLVRAYSTLSNARQRKAYNERLKGKKRKRRKSALKQARAAGVRPPVMQAPPRPSSVPPRPSSEPARPSRRTPPAKKDRGSTNSFDVIEPNNPSLAARTAVLHLQAGELQEAVDELRKSVRKSPNDCPAVTLLGYSLYLLDPVSNMSQATTYLQHAASMDLNAYEPCLYLGRIFDFAQDRRSALTAYQQCLSREPRQQEARKALLRLRKLIKK